MPRLQRFLFEWICPWGDAPQAFAFRAVGAESSRPTAVNTCQVRSEKEDSKIIRVTVSCFKASLPPSSEALIFLHIGELKRCHCR